MGLSTFSDIGLCGVVLMITFDLDLRVAGGGVL